MTADASLLIHVVRTGFAEASVLGVALTTSDVVQLLVNGTALATTTPLWNLDYWFLHVAVSNGSTVQTRIGTTVSSIVTVPAYVPQRVGPPGFIYAKGPNLMLNGSVIQLFGVDDQYPFIYALMASGLWGAPADPSYWGHNGLFPSGPDGYIPNVSDANSFWREYFRYFLHYQGVSSEPYNPRPNLLRVWVADDTWYPDGTYNAWQSNPTAFWAIFDAMVYWAGRAGIYLVPVLGHFSDPKDNTFFNTSSTHYAHQVALAKAITSRYNNNGTIAMWDLWNEPDVNDDVYWASVGGNVGFKAWASRYLADVKPSSSNHPLTMGIGGWTLFPGVPSFGWQYFFFFSEIAGLEVTSLHGYATAEDQYLIDWETGWHQALGVPHFEGEYGYNAYPGPSPLGYGYWPWFTAQTRAAGWPAISTMVFLDDGKGPYSDYPYSGSLPSYPAAGSSPPPPSSTNDTTPPAAVTDLRVVAVNASSATLEWTAPGDDGMTGQATWYDFRYSTSGPITESTFYDAVHYELPFFPDPPGTTEVATIPGLQPSTTYWFAIKTSDEVPNWSPISNVPNATTSSPPVVDTTPPSVGFSAPAAGSTLSGSVQVTVWATDVNGVASVSVYVDQSLLGTLSSPPYTWVWSTSVVKNGGHQLKAVASDPSGNLGVSTITVKVKNPPKVRSIAWNTATSSVDIVFSTPMNRSSVETSIRTDPTSPYTVVWSNESAVSLLLVGPLRELQVYLVTIDPNASDTAGVLMAVGVSYEFVPVPGTSPTYMYAALALVLAAIVVSFVGAIRRRHRDSRHVALAAEVEPSRSGRSTSNHVPRSLATGGVLGTTAMAAEPRVPLSGLGATADGLDMAGFEAWLDRIEAEIATVGDRALPPRHGGSRADAEPHAPPGILDRPLQGTTKMHFPRPGVWTEVAARAAIEKYLRVRPEAQAREIAKNLGMDLAFAIRMTSSVRDRRTNR